LSEVLVFSKQALLQSTIQELIRDTSSEVVVYCCSEGRGAIETLEFCSNIRHVIFDATGESTSALSFASQIIDTRAGISVLVLTEMSDKIFLSVLLDIGVSVVLSNSSDRDDATKGIRCLIQGQKYISKAFNFSPAPVSKDISRPYLCGSVIRY
jgi:DNA-binding NarL/FixJ family response regulator